MKCGKCKQTENDASSNGVTANVFNIKGGRGGRRGRSIVKMQCIAPPVTRAFSALPRPLDSSFQSILIHKYGGVVQT